MKSLLHRLPQDQLADWKRKGRPPQPEPDPLSVDDRARVSVRFVDGAVGWFLGDTRTHLRLRALYAPPRASSPPRGPRGVGDEWRKIFETVYHRFKGLLSARGEGDRWTSYSLSYMALRRCALPGKHEQLAYVHKACVNAHRKYRKRLLDQERPVRSGGGPALAVAGPEDIDLRLDLEDVLSRFPAIDAAVCRMHLLDGMTFREIGAALGIDASTANRRFDRRIGVIRVTLSDYAGEASAAPSAASVAA